MAQSSLHQAAIDLFLTGVDAADPYNAVKSALVKHPLSPNTSTKTIIVAIGKAAGKMARAAKELIPDAAQTLVITNYENKTCVKDAQIFLAGHPVPDENGLKAGQALIDLLARADQENTILCLISGGASALVPAPVAGVSLQDKAKVNQLLLDCGADIVAMNLVRQNLSRLKGGGLVRIAAPASVRALVLSDVIGDDIRAIASGPTAQKLGDKKAAVQMLKDYGIWQATPDAVQQCLQSDEEPTLPMLAENRLVGSNGQSLAAIHANATQGYIYPDPVIGDVKQAARTIADFIQRSNKKTIFFGGETTVKLTGTGLGGRNQELAMRVALRLETTNIPGEWVFLSGGTDGRDGPCDAAGGIVDNSTIRNMQIKGVDPIARLQNNDSYHALEAVDALLKIGATGTNVADLQIFMRR